MGERSHLSGLPTIRTSERITLGHNPKGAFKSKPRNHPQVLQPLLAPSKGYLRLSVVPSHNGVEYTVSAKCCGRLGARRTHSIAARAPYERWDLMFEDFRWGSCTALPADSIEQTVYPRSSSCWRGPRFGMLRCSIHPLPPPGDVGTPEGVQSEAWEVASLELGCLLQYGAYAGVPLRFAVVRLTASREVS